MKYYQINTLFIFLFCALQACTQETTPHFSEQPVSAENAEATAPYFTKDTKGNPVLCWSEKAEGDSLFSLRYAFYNPDSDEFSEPITIPESYGLSTAPESMGKVAFKGDGTVIAVFNKPFANPITRFASGIYYVLSFDQGASWTEPVMIHTDTSEGYGRSFFDIERMADGEVAAIWLDGRFGDKETGSALFFARTQKGEGFGENLCIDPNTCECCRTDLLIDKDGKMHIAYRGIQQPEGSFAKQVRDMLYTSSTDNGQQFSKPIPVAIDQWEIEGCPHTGPSLALTKEGVHALWFTGAGTPGLYSSFLKNGSQFFEPKTERSLSGRHPQQIALGEESLGVVWDEALEKANPSEAKDEVHLHSKASSTPSLGSVNRMNVRFTKLVKGKVGKSFILNSEGSIAHHPVVATANDRVLTAWVNESGGKSRIVFVSFTED